MIKIFYPAISLMNKLGYIKKMTLLSSLYFISLSIIIFSIYTTLNKNIQNIELELQGTNIISPLLKVMQATQKHGGLSASFINGNQKLIDALMQELKIQQSHLKNTQTQLNKTQRGSPLWKYILFKQQEIEKSGLSWTAEHNFKAHTHLVRQLQKFLIQIADQYQLILDDELASHYIIQISLKDIPIALEKIGQIRAYGSGVLEKKSLSEQDKIKLFSLLSQLNNQLLSLDTNLTKTEYLNRPIKDSLTFTANKIKFSSQQITQIVHDDILSTQFSYYSQDFFHLITEEMNSHYQHIENILLPRFRLLLQERKKKAQQKLWLSIGITLFISLLIQYLFYGFYYANLQNIQRINYAINHLTKGDFQQRIQLKTQDEMQQIGDCFNHMAENFEHLLNSHIEAKNRVELILNTALDAIVQINAQGIIITWNKQAEKIFGWPKNEILGENILLIIPSQHQNNHLNGIKHYLQTGTSHIINKRIIIEGLHYNNNSFPIELTIAPLETKEGIEFTAFIRDLTQQQQAEQHLQKLSLAVEQSPSSIIITNTKPEIEYANTAFSKITGYSVDEVIGKNPNFLSAHKTSPQAYKEMWSNLKQGKTWQGELINRRKNNSEYLESILISPVRQKNGEITHYLAIKDDISLQKQAEIDLGIAAIAFESKDGIIITNSDNIILKVNKSFTVITGYSPEDVIV